MAERRDRLGQRRWYDVVVATYPGTVPSLSFRKFITRATMAVIGPNMLADERVRTVTFSRGGVTVARYGRGRGGRPAGGIN